MANEFDRASHGLRSIAASCEVDSRLCVTSRNILLGLGAITETIIGVVDLAGVDYHSQTLSPYIMNGGSWLAIAGIAHFSGRHWSKMSEDFCEGARDVEVLDTYSNPEKWDQILPEE